ncbi:MAG: CpaF family protein [Planctomycetes bacterium]|nr:CpaF family protein [Planctomycetota bacterium]
MARVDIFSYTVEHFLEPILPFLRDESVSEVMINRFDEIYIERDGVLVRTEARFADSDAFIAAVNNVLQYTGKRLTAEQPMVDSRLPDGSRVHVVLFPLSRRGTCMNIRKFAKRLLDADELTRLGSWTDQVRRYLEVCVLAEKNILVAGGTSSGKTSLLNVLGSFIPPHQRIVTIEDSGELRLPQEHVVSLEARRPDRYGRGEIAIGELFRSSLRLRPDRIIIGEVRGGEALDVIQAMTSGHAGSMSTLHANTVTDALNRLETMAMMNKVELPLYALRAQITSAIDIVVQLVRFSDGRRVMTAAAEVLPLDDRGRYCVHEVFTCGAVVGQGKRVGDQLTWTGRLSCFAEEPAVKAQEAVMGPAAEVFATGGGR